MAEPGVEVLFLAGLLEDVCATPTGLDAVVREVAGEGVRARLGSARLRPHHRIAGYPDHFALDDQVALEPLRGWARGQGVAQGKRNSGRPAGGDRSNPSYRPA